MVNGLCLIGIDAKATDDGAIIHGTGGASVEGGNVIETSYDHRIAMSFAIATLRCMKPLIILDADSISTSFPNFTSIAKDIGFSIEENP